MKLKTVFSVIFLISLGALLICAALWPETVEQQPLWEQGEKNEHSAILPPKSAPAKSVSEDSGGIESYILKYDPKADKVLLITCYKDKSRHTTDLPEINPIFLEEEDIGMLTQGIELTSKEDMLILIEDYSS